MADASKAAKVAEKVGGSIGTQAAEATVRPRLG